MSDHARRAAPGAPRRLVSIVPNSGLQFVDCRFNIDALANRDCAFWEEIVGNEPDDTGRLPVVLRPLVQDERTRELRDPASGREPPEDEVYRINRAKALEVFLDKFVPLPYFRVRARAADGGQIHDTGPGNWARLRIHQLAERDRDGNSHQLTILFDTALRDRLPDRPYLAPSPTDSEEEQEFALTADPAQNAWFLAEGWVDEWLDELFREQKQAQKGGRPLRPDDFPWACEHWARYLAFLALLDDAGVMPRVKLIDVVSRQRRYEPISVDLVLDVGNSRTCGIMIEYNHEDHFSLNDSYRLKLRDLGRPEIVYDRPFESRIEFAHAAFGKEVISRRSGRANAFNWPSPVRIGPEAMRLASGALGTEGMSGLSSPKRYLWDERPLTLGWRYNGTGSDGVTSDPPVSGPFMAYLSEDGEVLRQSRRSAGQPAVRPKFSRSSTFTLLLAETLMQALAQINSVETRSNRKNSEVPRRLKRLILTMPPAMPLSEQRILRRRAEGAIKLTWDLMGWGTAGAGGPPEPRVVLNLDEASCTQFVYLYNEITERFQGDAESLFAIWGKERPDAGPGPSLRVASIDIGGGTTDLMVTTFTVEGKRAINPVQNFREGFRIAGDDVLAAVIERQVLPMLGLAMAAAGVADPGALLRHLFGGDRGGQSELDRHLRRQFVAQVLEPVGIAMLHSYEQSDRPQGEMWRRPIGSFFPAELRPRERVLDYVGKAVARHAAPGAPAFDVLAVEVGCDWSVIDQAARSVLGEILSDLSEVVHAYDTDVLLVSGRPSQLPAVQDILLAKMPVMPDRMVAMHLYDVGSWYPFRDTSSRINDPKTTAAVGAMLYTLAEGFLESFLIRASQIRMKSTARFIGELEISGQIRNANVFLSDVDLDAAAAAREQSAKIQFFAPMFIGYRQLPVERWQAAPLYRMEFSNPDNAGRLMLPLQVTLERAAVEEGDEEAREDFRIAEITDARGDGLRVSDVRLRLQTLKSEAGYWLDTGILSVR